MPKRIYTLTFLEQVVQLYVVVNKLLVKSGRADYGLRRQMAER